MTARKAYTPEELRELAAEPLDVFHPHLVDTMRGALRFSADVIEAANEALSPPALDLAAEVYAMAQGPQPMEDAFKQIATWLNQSAMTKVGTVSTLMGDLCIIKLDGFTVRSGNDRAATMSAECAAQTSFAMIWSTYSYVACCVRIHGACRTCGQRRCGREGRA